ncbi:hypothetical protein DRE_06587 [Drechslerella stenobrocha 248]|uniref:Inner kinetochore subunit AME1 domain-containing protein n=1 Tax=Drechslerella stenobrocha 248 TaxID=1043628 RepID=W7HL30_9PEZI|nr:hypothetical protein DRE_06587 [Drechslerella stenobrocha 248]
MRSAWQNAAEVQGNDLPVAFDLYIGVDLLTFTICSNRVVLQTFGFDLPLITATPPAGRTQRATEKVETIEPAAEEQHIPITAALQPVPEEPHRRRSGRLSRGSSVQSSASVHDVVVNSEGSARKRRRLDSRSPGTSVSSHRSFSRVIETTPDVISNGRPTPEIITSEADLEPIATESAEKISARTTPRVSTVRTSLVQKVSSLALSSPSPLPSRNYQPAAPSSVSPEPLQFIPDPPDSEVAITPELVKTTLALSLQSTPIAPTTSLRGAKKRSSKPAIATTTPIPRSKRRRQPSPDKFLTPEKDASQEPDIRSEQESDHVGEQSAEEEETAAQPINQNAGTEQELASADATPTKPAAKRRGRKRKTKQPSIEIPIESLPSPEEEPVLSDVEGELVEESYEQDLENGTLEEVDEEEDVEEEGSEEELEEPVEEEVVRSPRVAGRPRKHTANAPRQLKLPGASKRRNRNGEPKETFDITVYRIPKHGEYNFKFPNQANNIQIVSEVLHGMMDKQLHTLSVRKKDERDREEKARIKIREAIVTNLSSELDNRFISMASKADNVKMKRARLRRLQREKLRLRDELMQIRESREDIARQMDAVRRKHEEASEKADKKQYLNDTLTQIGAILEQAQASAAVVPPEERELTSASLDDLLASVTEGLCSSGDGLANGGGGKGILDQVKEMNRFLEAATEVLRAS